MDTTNNKPTEIKDIGLTHWERTRREFTKDHTPYDINFDPSKAYKTHKILKDVDPSSFGAIYKTLVAGKRFQQPIPLSFCQLVIQHGWRNDGLVPPTFGLGHKQP
jgi:hypothetical protein